MKKISSFLLLLLLSGMMIQPSYSLNDAQLERICSSTVHYSFCMIILKSNPRTASADNPRLLGIAVELARSSGFASLSIMKSIERRELIPFFKQQYRICSAHFASGISLLNGAKQSLRLKDYGKVVERALSAMFKYIDCRNVMEDGKLTANVRVREMNDYMYNVCDIAVVAAREVADGGNYNNISRGRRI